jgi:uncharacterized membrane protein
MNAVVSEEKSAKTDMAKIIYVLYLASILIGVTAIVGVVLAYVYKDEAPEWLKTHYQFQIRTFWIMLLYAVICGILCLILIGFLLYLVLLVWWIVRCVKGLSALDRKAAYPNPTGWGF